MRKISRVRQQIISFFAIMFFLISTSNISVNAAQSNSLFSINRSGLPSSVKAGDTFDVTYTIAPNPIPVQQNTSKKDIVLVIDTSGSMNDSIGGQSKISTIKTAAKNFIDNINSNSSKGNFNIGLVEFSSYACKDSDILPVSSQSSTLKNIINNLQVGGATNTGDGIRTAKAMLDADTSAKEKYIILMTDGVTTAYSKDKSGSRQILGYIFGFPIYGNYIDDYLGAYINTTINHTLASQGYTLNNGWYITYNGIQTTTDPNALEYATNVVSSMIKNDQSIKSFMVVGFGSDAGSSNAQIVDAAGGYNDNNNNFVKKGQYYSAQDGNALQTLYNQFANNIVTTVNGTAAFQETFSNNLQVVNSDNLPYGLQVSGNVVSGNINVQYTLSNDKTQYVASPIQFTIKYQVNSYGVCSWGRGGNSSYVQLTESGQTQTQYFNEQDLQVSDVTPPTGTITADKTSWTNGSVNLTCTGTDSESGVASIQKPDGTWITGATAIYTVNSNGTYSFNIKDNAGNVGTASITVINIDTTPPTLSLSETPTTPTNGNVTINVTASDNVAIAATKWASGTQTANYFSTGGTTITGGSFIVSANGIYTAYAVDAAGNATVQTINITNINNSTSKFGTISGYVWLDSNENGIMDPGEEKVSGIEIDITNNGGHVWGNPSDTNGYYSYSAFNNGNHIVSVDLQQLQAQGYRLTKMGGDSKVDPSTGESDSIKPPNNNMNIGLISIDTTPPTAPTITVTPKGWTNGNVSFTIGGSTDTGSGLKKYQYQIDGGSWIDYSTAVTISNEGTHIINAIAIDNAGNVSTPSTANAQIDKTAPTITLTSTQTDEGTIITANVTDSESGVAITKWEQGAKNISDFASTGTVLTGNTFTVSSNGTYTVYAKDNAGNENVQTITIGHSSIIALGAYMRNNTSSNYIYEGTNGQLNVVKSIPMAMAMIVDIESSNPQINLSIKGAYNGGNITFTKYNLNNNLIDSSSAQSVTLSSSAMVLTNNSGTFDLKSGNKYIIVYSITPNGNGSNINVSASVANQTVSKNVILNIQDLPKVE